VEKARTDKGFTAALLCKSLRPHTLVA
jgi:hypothetical protein